MSNKKFIDPRLKNTIQAHGLTHSEFEEVRQMQEDGNPLPMMTGNNAKPEQINDPIFREAFANYQIPKIESDIYVLAMEARTFDSATGQKLSVPFVQKYDQAAYKAQLEHSGFVGYTTHILHNPKLSR